MVLMLIVAMVSGVTFSVALSSLPLLALRLVRP
jgi:hypothetical protein